MLASSLTSKSLNPFSDWPTLETVLDKEGADCIFLRSDKPYSIFKPGQHSLERDYYKDATKEKADGGNCLENFSRFGSEYGKKVDPSVKPGDYVVPSKDANNLIQYDLMNNPKLFGYTRRAGYDPAATDKML